MLLPAVVILCATAAVPQNMASNARPRSSDLGLKVGVLPTGALDAITDVAGVEVGHTTIIRGDDIRTGVTAILPHPGNLYREKGIAVRSDDSMRGGNVARIADANRKSYSRVTVVACFAHTACVGSLFCT
jgi:L-aminopeptidase/D-esterase-like protein